jgi:hypothetical protein
MSKFPGMDLANMMLMLKYYTPKHLLHIGFDFDLELTHH